MIYNTLQQLANINYIIKTLTLIWCLIFGDVAYGYSFTSEQAAKVSEEFRICAQARSTVETTSCFIQQEQVFFDNINKELKQITANLNPEEFKKYNELEKAAFEFFKAKASKERDTYGSITDVLIVEEEVSQRKWFKYIIQIILTKPLTDYSYYAKDEYMKDLFKILILRNADIYKSWEKGEVGKFADEEDLLIVQEQFCIFREKFAEFGVTKYPDTKLDDWKAWVTKIRIEQIHNLLMHGL